MRSCWGWLLWPVVLGCNGLAAQPDTNAIPPLRPPRPEIPPGFLESHLGWIIALGIATVAGAGLAVWLWRRARPVIAVPPAAQARDALSPLHGRAETGALLSQVSQVLQRYARRVFGLPEEEMTTTDLGRALSARQETEARAAGAIVEFLRVCDERKFAPAQPPQPLGAVARAEALIDALEQEQAERVSAETGQGRTAPPGSGPGREDKPA